MQQGWISLNRKIQDNWIWNDKPFSKGQAWIDILLRVNHKANKIPIGNQIIELKEGQTIWSIDKMSNSWGWSNRKVSNFLNMLTNDGALSQKRTSKYTMLTVANWELYQNTENQKHIKSISKAYQKHTNNNDNNEISSSSGENSLFNFYENEIGMISNTIMEKLINWQEEFTDDIIKKAIEKATLNNVRKFNYINTILNSWKSEGVKVIADIQDKKDKKPKNFDRKDIKIT